MTKRSVKHVLRALWLALALIAMSGAAFAIEAKPKPINDPVPIEWRKPFAEFLRGLNMQNIDGVLDRAKTWGFNLAYGKWVVLRLEEEALCRQDICQTIIGRLEDGRFVVGIMFWAGKEIAFGDTTVPIFGVQSFPVKFISNQNIVHLLETSQGWVVIPAMR